MRASFKLQAIRFALVVIALIAFLSPIAWTLLASVGFQPDNNTSPPSWKGSFTFENFADVGIAEPSFWAELATSAASAVCASALTVCASLPAAYGLARSRFHGHRLLSQGFLVLATLPAMAYVIPLSDVIRRLHLVDTFVGLVLTESAVTAPLAIYVLQGAIRQLAPEWEEAAWLEGAALWRILIRIVLPVAAPAAAATALILFVLDWNLLIVPLVLTSGELKTLPVAMSDFFTFERELEWPTAAAALTISLAPVVVLVAVFHGVLDHFATGIGSHD